MADPRKALITGSTGQDERLAARSLACVGHPDQIGQAVLFLADGTRSAFITGQALIIDGSATAALSTE